MYKNVEHLLAKGPMMVFNNLHKMRDKVMGVIDETLNLDLKKQCSHSELMLDSNFLDKEDMYVVEIDLPGIDIENVELLCQADKLIVRGERKNPSDLEHEKSVYINQNINYGKFEEVFTMPLEIDDTKVKATHRNGVLTITLPKINKESKAKKIKIETEPKKSHHTGQPE